MRSPDESRPVSHGRIIGFYGAVAVALIAGSVAVSPSIGDSSPSEVLLSANLDAPVAALPVEVNARVRYWMERFTTDQRSTFELYMSRKGRYEDLVVERLRRRGMPDELLYLAMIESGFLPRASSQVSAVGLWQFMGPTAQQYGLRVDNFVDERRDPLRATDAALTYLQWLHDRYDSWYLAAAAYNAGPGRVDRALRQGGSAAATDDVDLYWEIIDHLPRETREHVPKLLAATILARNAGALGFQIEPVQPYAFDRVWVPGGTTLRVVARELDVPAQLIRDLNPHLVRGVTPPGGSYGLRVPVGRTAQVVASIGGGRWGSQRAADD